MLYYKSKIAITAEGKACDIFIDRLRWIKTCGKIIYRGYYYGYWNKT